MYKNRDRPKPIERVRYLSYDRSIPPVKARVRRGRAQTETSKVPSPLVLHAVEETESCVKDLN